MDSDDLPTTNADRLLNRSYWWLLAKLRFKAQETETSFTTVAEQRAYADVVDVEAVQSIAYHLADGSEDAYDPLIKIDDWNMFPQRDDEVTGRPTHYSRRGDDLIFYPNPDAAYTVRVKLRATLVDIQSSGTELPREWDEVILMGAVYRGYFLRGDINRSEKFRVEWMSLVNSLPTDEEKEMEDVRYSSFKVIRPRYR